MANTLGTGAGAIIALRTIDYLKEMFPPALRAFVNFSDQRIKKGQALTTRTVAVGAAYDASSGYSATDVTDTDKSVTASNFKAVTSKFTPNELSSTDRDLIDEHASAMANELGKDFWDVLCALVVNANFSNNNTETNANYDDDTIRKQRRLLNARNVGLRNRIGIVNSDAWEALTGDSTVITTDSNPAAHEQFSLAPMSMRQRGFEIFEYPNLPTNSENLNGFFMAPGAIIGATGIPKDANEEGFWEDVPRNASVVPRTDPDTGITLLERRTRHEDGSASLDLAWVFGLAAGDANMLERTVTA